MLNDVCIYHAYELREVIKENISDARLSDTPNEDHEVLLIKGIDGSHGRLNEAHGPSVEETKVI